MLAESTILSIRKDEVPPTMEDCFEFKAGLSVAAASDELG